MNDKQLLKIYMDAFGHLDLDPEEILSVEEMLSSCVFTKDDAERVFTLLSSPSNCSYNC